MRIKLEKLTNGSFFPISHLEKLISAIRETSIYRDIWGSNWRTPLLPLGTIVLWYSATKRHRTDFCHQTKFRLVLNQSKSVITIQIWFDNKFGVAFGSKFLTQNRCIPFMIFFSFIYSFDWIMEKYWWRFRLVFLYLKHKI